MSKEATIIQSFNDVKRQYEYFVKGYDVTESVGILLKRHKEAYDKEKKVFAGIDGYLEAQKEYQSQIVELQSQLDDTKAKLETAEYWNKKYDDCQRQLHDLPAEIMREIEEKQPKFTDNSYGFTARQGFNMCVEILDRYFRTKI